MKNGGKKCGYVLKPNYMLTTTPKDKIKYPSDFQ